MLDRVLNVEAGLECLSGSRVGVGFNIWSRSGINVGAGLECSWSGY